MWYVIQTIGGKEEETADMIRKMVSSNYMEECFIPKRERMKKFHGSWNKVEEILFHGYVFVVSEKPEKLYQKLKQVPRLTKLLGREKDYFFPLNIQERNVIREIGNKEHITSISKVMIDKNKKVYILDGPLKNYMGNTIKVDLHRREIVIQLEFIGRTVKLHMGIEIVE
ncbi:MAG: antiterminator LoaP [Hungatella sp.]|nr:antiterminator LoaP [Hungatella sp.]